MKSPLLESIEARTALPVVDTKNGAQIHPDAIANFGESLTSGDGTSNIYSAGREALKTLGETLTKIRLADQEVRIPDARAQKELAPNGNESRWPIHADHVEKFSAALADAYKKADSTFTKSAEVVANGIDALTNQMGVILTDPKRDSASRALEGESIRQHIRSLPPAERMMLLGTLAKEGRQVAVAAVLGADPICSGLTAADHALLRTVAEQSFAPSLYAKRESARAVQAHLKTAGLDFAARYEAFKPRANVVTTEKIHSALDDLSGKAKKK